MQTFFYRVRMLAITGDWESRGQLANPGLPGKVSFLFAEFQLPVGSGLGMWLGLGSGIGLWIGMGIGLVLKFVKKKFGELKRNPCKMAITVLCVCL